jgi:hypothetical protein
MGEIREEKDRQEQHQSGTHVPTIALKNDAAPRPAYSSPDIFRVRYTS